MLCENIQKHLFTAFLVFRHFLIILLLSFEQNRVDYVHALRPFPVKDKNLLFAVWNKQIISVKLCDDGVKINHVNYTLKPLTSCPRCSLQPYVILSQKGHTV